MTFIKQGKEIIQKTSLGSLFYLLKDSYRQGKTYQSVLQLKVGDKAPNFKLPNAFGKIIQLKHILADKNVVLIFYRGGWCPFCNLQLRKYQKHFDQFEKENTTLIAISPQVPDQSLNLTEKQNLKFEVLSDVGNQIAKKYTTVFRYDEKSITSLNKLGINLNDFYENAEGEVPIPAVFIINQDGFVTFAESEGGDFKKRVEPETVLAALEKSKKVNVYSDTYFRL